MAYVDLTGIKNLQRKLDKIENIDATPLMVSFQKIISDDNRRGILNGEDRWGNIMLAVTYRPKGTPTNIKGRSDEARRQRNGAKANAKQGRFAGFGPLAAGLHNNLTSSEYRKLSGPPLAPRGVFSRVITNLVTSFIVDPSRRAWTAVAGWANVVDVHGRSFLNFHFTGAGRLPRRDLRGVRPEGRAKAQRAAVAFVRDLIRSVD
ncbi:hypothetical protein [Paludisphaera rhizosphaerae]|uniref:hypothetical protein n=1 Tax=Paludisphaera rhizosphaerae TaxID=2711216 RepID=UPI0013E9CCEF|nr:hypothetical protein [Paludisphaera rhizosphaerae]